VLRLRLAKGPVAAGHVEPLPGAGAQRPHSVVVFVPSLGVFCPIPSVECIACGLVCDVFWIRCTGVSFADRGRSYSRASEGGYALGNCRGA